MAIKPAKVSQPSKMPTRKVFAGGLAGVISAGLMQYAEHVANLTPHLAFLNSPSSQAFIPIAAAVVAAYIIKDRINILPEEGNAKDSSG